jgi:hypothetical protein
MYMYSLKNIRKIRGLDGAGVTASIYRDTVRIGWAQVPPDGSRALVTFDIEGERDGFEQFVHAWWQEARSKVAMDLLTLEIAAKDPGFVPSLPAKLRYWISSLVTEAASSRRLRSAA